MSFDDITYFFLPLYRLKELFRQGWIGKVPSSEIESVADHSYAVTFLCLLLLPIENELREKSNSNLKLLNKLEILEKSIVHDLPESQFLDLDKTMSGIISKEEFNNFKMKLDINAEKKIREIYNQFLKNHFSLEDLSILPIMNSKRNEEDEFIKLIDSIELYFQTTSYLRKGFISEENAKIFLDSAKKKVLSFSSKFLFVPYLFNEY